MTRCATCLTMGGHWERCPKGLEQEFEELRAENDYLHDLIDELQIELDRLIHDQ